MIRSTESLSASASIGIMGPSAVGKEELAVSHLAPMLDMFVINTGKSVRAMVLMAHEQDQFEEGRGSAFRLRRGAESRIRDWVTMGRRGIHYEVRAPDRSAHIFFGERDLTNELRPGRSEFVRQAVMEPAAALVATNPVIRRGLWDLWRRTSIEVGGGLVITKAINEYLPEAHAKYYLRVTDPIVSAAYRLCKGISATCSIADEIEYLGKRDQHHRKNGLDVVPPGALKIDTTDLLLKEGGLRHAADIVLADLATRMIRR